MTSKQSLLIASTLLLGWALWWGASLSQGRLALAESSWLPAWDYLGLDFAHSYLGSRAWLSGSNPYIELFGGRRGAFGYPPMLLPLFAWAAWFRFDVAAGLWAGIIALICAIAVHLGRLWHADQPRAPLLPVALVLWSAPVAFAMERGNADALILLCLIVASWGMTRPHAIWGSVLAGAVLAVAFWTKLYPLALLAGLFALRRRAAFLSLLLVSFLLGLLWRERLVDWTHVAQQSQASRIGPFLDLTRWLQGGGTGAVVASLPPSLWGSLHSPGNYWPVFWLRSGHEGMAGWPLLLVQFLVLGPVTAWGLWRMFRAQVADSLVFPSLLWITALATFWMPLSYDYNLLYLPILIVTIWDESDPAFQQFLLAASLLWWIPFGSVDGSWADLRVISKIVTLYGVTLALVRLYARPEKSPLNTTMEPVI